MSYPSMDFDAYYNIDCETLHGEGSSLKFTDVINIICKLIQRASTFDVVVRQWLRDWFKGSMLDKKHGMFYLLKCKKKKVLESHSYISFAWGVFVQNNPTTQVQIQFIQNMRCMLCHIMAQASNINNNRMKII
jgi:hypothetical protein